MSWKQVYKPMLINFNQVLRETLSGHKHSMCSQRVEKELQRTNCVGKKTIQKLTFLESEFKQIAKDQLKELNLLAGFCASCRNGGELNEYIDMAVNTN